MTTRPEDWTELKAALDAQAEALLVHLYGEPTKRGRRVWRWGRKGGRKYDYGSRLFWDYEIGAGGSLLDAVKLSGLCANDFPAAVAYARAWLGDDMRAAPAPRQQPHQADDKADRIAQARALWAAARSIEGTAAARYLIGRGITTWPTGSVRFIAARDVARIATNSDGEPFDWWRWPAIIYAAMDASGDVRAVQFVALNDDGSRAINPDGTKRRKITIGELAGCAVRMPADQAGALLLGEGPETVMSGWLPTGQEAWSMLGSWTAAQLDAVPIDRPIAVLLDDDPITPKTQNAWAKRRETIAAWRQAGRRVVTVWPWEGRRRDGSDFNDALKADGADAVRERIEAALRTLPQDDPPGVSLDAAKDLQFAALDAFDDRARAWNALPDDERHDVPPPVGLLNSTMGGGKSHAMRARAARLIQERPGNTVATFIPLHRLAEEQAADFQHETGLPASIWRGMSQPDPLRPGALMCLQPELTDAAQEAGLPAAAVCGLCPSRNDCGTRRQRGQDWRYALLPHQLLFGTKPAPIPRPTVTVIDEDFVRAGMTTGRLSPDMLRGDISDLAPDDRDALRAARANLLAAIRHDMPAAGTKVPTRLTLAALIEAGVTLDQARDAYRLEWSRKPTVESLELPEDDVPGMLNALGAAAGRFTAKIPQLWHLVVDLLEGGWEYSPGIELGGKGRDGTITLHWRRQIGEGWGSPAILLDGTARVGRIRHFFPQLADGFVTEISIAAPHQRVHLVEGAFSINRLVEKDEGNDDGSDPDRHRRHVESVRRWNKARRNNLADVRRFIEAKAAEYRGQARYDSPDVLVICNLAVEVALRLDPGLPPNVVVGHFNSLRGRNDWSHVRCIIAVGRTLPDAGEIQRQAERLAGRPLAPDDSLVADERWAICEAGLLQDIARGRGIRRTAANPLDVYVLNNDVALPLQPARVLAWEDAKAHPLDLMAARGVVPLCGPETRGFWPVVAELLPDLYDTPEAARMAVSRRSSRAQPSMNPLFLDECARETVRARAPGSRYAIPVLIEAAARDLLPLEILPPDPGDQPPPSDDGEALPVVEAPATELVHDLADQAPPIDALLPPGIGPPDYHQPDALHFGLSADPPASGETFTVLPVEIGGDDAPLLQQVVRAAMRDGARQQEIADLAGLSRPHLANFIAGRFGLSPDAMSRLRSALASLPVRQESLL